MAWIFLTAAILIEVGATLSLRMSTTGPRTWYVPVVLGYLAAFVLLSLTLQEGMNLGVAYGIWTATGVALTAVLSKYLFGEALTWIMSLGIGILILGVLLVELGASH